MNALVPKHGQLMFCYSLPSPDTLMMLGKSEDRRRKEQQSMRWLDSVTNTMDMNMSKLQEIVKDRAAWWVAIHRVGKESDTT